jgi:hypothetical protein
MYASLLLPLLAASAGRDVSLVHLSAGALRGAQPVTGRAARLAPSVAAQARLAGELGLDGWLADDVLLLGDAAEREAKALLAQVAAVRVEVDRCRPVDGAPFDLFHLRATGSYHAVVDRLADVFPDERDFLRSMRDASGFELTAARFRAVCVDATACACKNLLVHLSAHAWFDGEGEGAPAWLLEGLALEIETRICGAPVAFCGSGAHVPPASSSAWERRLARALACKDESAWAATFALPDGAASEAAAWRALGVVRWLRGRHEARFGDVVRAAAAAQADARERGADAAERARLQLRALESVLGSKWRDELAAAPPLTNPSRRSGRAGTRRTAGDSLPSRRSRRSGSGRRGTAAHRGRRARRSGARWERPLSA